MTQVEAVNWLVSKLGQYLDFDGQYGSQCFDSFNYYYQFLTGRNPYSDGYSVEGASQIWDVPTSLFKKIPDSASLVPEPGDILVYGTSWGGGYGHVEMVRSVDNNGVTIIGTNIWGNRNSGAQQTYRTWGQLNGLRGVLRLNSFVKGDTIMNADEERNAYQIVLERAMEHGGSGRTGYQFITAAKAELDAKRASQAKLIADLRALADKPAKEVKVEVEKIVTEYVDREVIKEVFVEVEPTWLTKIREAINGFLRRK